jgi:hypothetical protein
MTAAGRKLMHLDIDNRIAATATPAKMNLVESYDLANWASHHDKSLGPRARFQRVYGGYGAGTNAQDATMQQMVFREISPYISGNRLTNSTFKVNQEVVPISKTPIQDDNMRQIEHGTDAFVAQEKEKFIHSIEQNPELLARWEKNKGRDWRKVAGARAGEKAKTALMAHHWDNLQGTYGDKMQWKDNPKLVETAKYITSNPKEKHIIFVDNYAQRKAMTQALMEGGLKDGSEILNIAGTPEVTKRAIAGEDMAKRVATFQKDKNAKVIFIDKGAVSGYNLQSADVLHVIGTPSDAASYLQAQGRVARMPRFGDVKIRTYRYTDAPFEDDRWDSIDVQLKMLRAVAPAMFVGGKE